MLAGWRMNNDHGPVSLQPIKISVRKLLEVTSRTGDINFRFSSRSSALEGIRGHQTVQRSRPNGYQAEVSVTGQYRWGSLLLEVNGRMDGVYSNVSPVIIDEIKTLRVEVSQLPVSVKTSHWGQAKIYAYLYAVDNNLDRAVVQISYYHLDSGEMDEIQQTFFLPELKVFFENCALRFLQWLEKVQRWRVSRNQSIRHMAFPYGEFRDGQRSFSVSSYRAMASAGQLFVQAPTGIGKTIGSLFPAIKAIAEGHHEKVFFLTAKTSGRAVAEKSLADMQEKGLLLKTVTLTAKEKICFNPGSPCDPEHCEYAVGYYDKLNSVIESSLEATNYFKRDDIEHIARENTMCPFELSLDLLEWVDVVICDYNYVFDPVVYLRRLFDDPLVEHCFLVDEAHNLVDRGRDMFSAQIEKDRLLSVKRQLKRSSSVEVGGVLRKIDGINRAFLSIRKEHSHSLDQHGFSVADEPPTVLISKLRSFCEHLQHWLAEHERDGRDYDLLLDLYFDALRFTRTADYFDDHYVCLIKTDKKKLLSINLYCVDPSRLLGKGLERSKSSLFFSATLAPINYYQQLLGVSPTSQFVDLPSPFPHENQGVFVVKDIATNFKQREGSYNKIAGLIQTMIESHRGNYIVYFPSYQYMEKVHDIFRQQNSATDIIIQQRQMDDESRQWFLNRFDAANEHGLVGFAVMGGIFGEGIDLKGLRLIGVIIIGVGLPQMGIERDLIKQHFRDTRVDDVFDQHHTNEGFNYAYQYPGMNRVLQTAGRVIRSEQDRGVVCLVDERFASARYRQLFPPHWTNLEVINQHQLAARLAGFW